MFCTKCGNKMNEGAVFCSGCGTKTTNSQTQTPQIPTESITPNATIERSGLNEVESQPPTINALDEIPLRDVDSGDFKSFVDNHIKTNTKFASANELLTRSKPLTFIWVCLAIAVGIFATLGIINNSFQPVVLLVALFFGYAAAFVVGFFKRIRILKTQRLSKAIDTEDFINFLNANLNYITSDFGGWQYSTKTTPPNLKNVIDDQNAETVGEYAANLLQEIAGQTSVEIISSFRNKGVDVVIEFITTRDGESLYAVAARKRKSKLLGVLLKIADILGGNNRGTNTGFGEYKVVYLTAPILKAAVEYYIGFKSSEV